MYVKHKLRNSASGMLQKALERELRTARMRLCKYMPQYFHADVRVRERARAKCHQYERYQAKLICLIYKEQAHETKA